MTSFLTRRTVFTARSTVRNSTENQREAIFTLTGSEKKRREKSNGILKNAYIAHRGLHDGKSIPENSLGAINLAAKKGFVTDFAGFTGTRRI